MRWPAIQRRKHGLFMTGSLCSWVSAFSSCHSTKQMLRECGCSRWNIADCRLRPGAFPWRRRDVPPTSATAARWWWPPTAPTGAWERERRPAGDSFDGVGAWQNGLKNIYIFFLPNSLTLKNKHHKWQTWTAKLYPLISYAVFKSS